jgi:hypothetical protein
VLRLRSSPLTVTGANGEAIAAEELGRDEKTGLPRVAPGHPAIVEWRAMTVVLLCVFFFGFGLAPFLCIGVELVRVRVGYQSVLAIFRLSTPPLTALFLVLLPAQSQH